MEQSNDPWDWAKQAGKAPLGNTIAQSPQEQVGSAPQSHIGPITQMEQAAALGATAKGMEGAYKAYGSPLSTSAPTADVASQNILGATPAAMSSAPVVPTLGAEITGTSAPLMSTASQAALAGSAAETGALATTAVEGGALAAAPLGAATAGTVGAAGALGAGADAALMGMGPIGWGIGAALLAKKLKIF